MATITAAEVNKLRKQTGLGMMDCKKALVEAEGDFDQAIDILRKKGQKVAEKRGDRSTSEGHSMAKVNAEGNKGVIIALSCETDFVAINDAFIAFATEIVDTALNNNIADATSLLAANLADGRSIQENIIDQIGKIGEKIEVSDFALVSADTVIAYNHPGNNIASMVGLNKAGEMISAAGKDVAMQIAAMAPVALDESSVSEEIKAKELEIGRDQAIQEGKPEQIVDKIAMGRLKKFLKENTLVEQAYIKDNKMSVGQYLKTVDKDLEVMEFKRVTTTN
jgi:elongation factor Ts|tara:strand:- start:5277 stop:6113 length:837 start_codon:yes stop_codon:yes gene_type:complete